MVVPPQEGTDVSEPITPPAPIVSVVQPGHYSSEFKATVGLPVLDGVISHVLGSEFVSPEMRLGAYCLVGIYTLARTWLKGRAVSA